MRLTPEDRPTGAISASARVTQRSLFEIFDEYERARARRRTLVVALALGSVFPCLLLFWPRSVPATAGAAALVAWLGAAVLALGAAVSETRWYRRMERGEQRVA